MCVRFGTEVATPEGPLPIESLRVGDRVLSRAPDGSVADGRVTAVLHADAPAYLQFTIGTYELAVTAEHPLATPSGWVQAGSLGVGDRVLTDQGPLPVTSLIAVDKPTQVVDLTVEPHANFFAAGVLVHNKAPIPPTEEQLADAEAERSRDEAERVAGERRLETRLGEDGWSDYVQKLEVSLDSASEPLGPGIESSPEATVLKFFASRMQGDEAFASCLPSERNQWLDTALKAYDSMDVLKVELLRTKQGVSGSESVLIQIGLTFRDNGKFAGLQGDVSLELLDGWKITELPH